jgi:hypothetical protein
MIRILQSVHYCSQFSTSALLATYRRGDRASNWLSLEHFSQTRTFQCVACTLGKANISMKIVQGVACGAFSLKSAACFHKAIVDS